MDKALVLLRLLLFCLSALGSFLYVRKAARAEDRYVPFLTLSLQILVLFFAGLFNCLPATAWILYLAGFVSLFWFCLRDRSELAKFCVSPAPIVFFIGAGLFLVATNGHFVAHWDNFSHWARITRILFEQNHFPNFRDVLKYPEYPPASAAYIYFLGHFVRQTEPFQMLAQALFSLTCLLPLMPRDRHPLKWVLYALLCNFALCYNVNIHDLLVDTLVGLCGLAALLLEYECLQKQDGTVWAALPGLCVTGLIKSSGLFYAALGLFLLLPALKKGVRRDRLCLAGAPFACFYLWMRHCDYVFGGDAVMTKHALHIARFMDSSNYKSPEDLAIFHRTFFRFLVSGLDLWALLGFMLVLGILLYFLKKSYLSQYRRQLLCCLVVYLLYMVFLFLVYRLSMSGSEAMQLSEAGRYRRSLLLPLYLYLLWPHLTSAEGGAKPIQLCAALLALTVCVHCLSCGKWQTIFDEGLDSFHPQRTTYSETTHRKINKIYTDYKPERGEPCIVIHHEEKVMSDYLWQIAQYEFRTEAVLSQRVEGADTQLDLSRFTYMIVPDPEEEHVHAYIEAHFPEFTGERLIPLT